MAIKSNPFGSMKQVEAFATTKKDPGPVVQPVPWEAMRPKDKPSAQGHAHVPARDATRSNTPPPSAAPRTFADLRGARKPAAQSDLMRSSQPTQDACATRDTSLSPQERLRSMSAALATSAARNPFGDYTLNTQVLTPTQPSDFSNSAARSSGSSKHKPNDEQKAIIECSDDIVIARACAGSGKTSTGVMFTEARRNARILYLAYNASMAKEASSKFPKNVSVMTVNGLAYRNTPDWMKSRLDQSFKASTLADQMRIQSARMARLAMIYLTDFMNSDYREITDSNPLPAAAGEFGMTLGEQSEAIALARQAWKRMNDPTETMSLPHDAYLKRFAQSKPILDYEHIILDEFQDTNGVTFDLIENQYGKAKILYLGDPHQSIYAFRGAVDAIDRLKNTGTHLHLSQTYRFGPKTAHWANLVLSELKGETVPIRGMGIDDEGPFDCETLLARTNATLLKQAAARHGKGIHWVGNGGAASYRLNDCLDVWQLFEGNHFMIKSPAIKRFRSYNHLKDEAEEGKDKELLSMVSLVEEFGRDLPQIAANIAKNEVKDPERASAIYTTAHRSKGLEFTYVRIADDFSALDDAEDELKILPKLTLPTQQEVNLYAVAITRAKKKVLLDDMAGEWAASLESHRSNRKVARYQQIQRLPRQ